MKLPATGTRRFRIIERIQQVQPVTFKDLYTMMPELQEGMSLVTMQKELGNLHTSGVLIRDGHDYSVSAEAVDMISKKDQPEPPAPKKYVGQVATPRTGNVFGSVLTGYAANMLRAAETRENTLHRYIVTQSGVSVIANDQAECPP